MGSNLDMSVTLVALAPFIAAALAPVVFRFTGAFAGWVLAIVPASIFIFLLSFVEPISQRRFVQAGFDWITSYGIRFSFFIDGLSLTFALLVSGIGIFIILYSGAYLKGHPHQGRFLSFMLMFMGSMLGLVLSDNMITLFVFWELTSVTSFLLIGFDHKREAARRAAFQALVVTAGGGMALLAGLILLQQMTGVWEISSLYQFGPAIREQEGYFLVLILVLAGAFTKSAQFPFHFWLPNAMEAPTPVSAYLHSATMVNAGVYLLARMNPILGGSAMWSIILPLFGGVTLLWGATMALKQSDLKQMLAQTTVASLGLMVLLIGLGSEAAIMGAILYLIAHAFYKGAMFMIVGGIDHATGTRDINSLGGLWRIMPMTFIAVLLAAAGMAGLPATVAFLAKEEMYSSLMLDNWIALLFQRQNMVVIITLVLGNAMVMAAGLAILFKAFFGPQKSTPINPHEGSFSLWIGALVLGLFAAAFGVMLDFVSEFILGPAASTVYNLKVEPKLYLNLSVLAKPAFLLSALTWALGIVLFLKIDDIRASLARMARALNWSFDDGFDWLISSLVRSSDAITRFWHNGRMELYMVVVFVSLAIALYVPLVMFGALPGIPALPELRFYEWAIFAIAVIGLLTVVFARTRLVAIVSLGIQGFAVALIFMLFGAPDLGFTQFMVETLTVVILALVMTRLHLEQRDRREWNELLFDGALALIIGVGVTMLMLAVLKTPLDMRLSDFFAQTSYPIAHGRNIVNVILVDFRGLDTLGEISVVMTAGIAILALIRIRSGGPQRGVGAIKGALKNIKSPSPEKPGQNKAAKSPEAGVQSSPASKLARKKSTRAKSAQAKSAQEGKPA
ncbi:Na(+) H(+) antiporter subunit A [hydrothermal vent metagenome]|uniref:Na(+) H(+) antiporter subunit A n=1 Tax=hydrothermal vent metagenome TaxID=652676 RepID=A0A3B0T971_9ZZZZ